MPHRQILPLMALSMSSFVGFTVLSNKAVAAINGRDFITPDDIKKVVGPILCHRIILTPEREMEGLTAEKMVQDLIQTIEIPR